MNKNLPEMRCFEYDGFSTFELNEFETEKKIYNNISGELTLKGSPSKFGSQTKKDFNYKNRSKGREKLFIGFVSRFSSDNIRSLNICNTYKQLFDFIQQDKMISDHFKIFLFNNSDILSQGYITGKNMHLLLRRNDKCDNNKTIWPTLCSTKLNVGVNDEPCKIINTSPMMHISFQSKNRCEIITYTSKYLEVKENKTEMLLIGHLYQKLVLDNTNCSSDKLSIKINRKLWLKNQSKELEYFAKVFPGIDLENISESKAKLNEELEKFKKEEKCEEILLSNENAFKNNMDDIKIFNKAINFPTIGNINGKENFLQEINQLNQYQLSNQCWQLSRCQYMIISIVFIGIGAFNIAASASELFDSNIGYIIGSLALFCSFILLYLSTKEYQEEKQINNEVKSDIEKQIKYSNHI